MNLMEGEITDGTFRGDNVAVPGVSGAGKVTLGFRAEDAHVTEAGQGAINADVYSMELLGDATMVTVRAGGALVAVKAAKDYRARIGEAVGIALPEGITHLFDASTGQRI